MHALHLLLMFLFSGEVFDGPPADRPSRPDYGSAAKRRRGWRARTLVLSFLATQGLCLSFAPRESANFKRSYLRRRGQATKAQKRALRELWPKYGLDLKEELAAVGERPVILDVGFGSGESTLALAQNFPDHNVLGCEVRRLLFATKEST